MIGSLSGKLAFKQPPRLMLDVNGVGYEIEAPMSTFYHLPEVGGTVKLLTHLTVREDAHILYGFATPDERRLFRSLIKVSGVGGRVALAILSGISVDGFVRCVEEKDAVALTRVPGIGKKTSERLIVEMRDKISLHERPPGENRPTVATDAAGEAYDALLALGYRSTEATRMLKSVETTDRSAEDIIRDALKAMVKTKA